MHVLKKKKNLPKFTITNFILNTTKFLIRTLIAYNLEKKKKDIYR